jgi:uncharacterized protein YggU (UPF0235/DUF167 family)
VRTILVKVKPNAKTTSLEPPRDAGPWRATLKAPPVDGKANAELVALVAEYFGCPKSAVWIRGGASGRLKRVCVKDP